MSATVEKKVALTIEMKTAGGQQIGQLTVNLKGLDDASKKAASSGEKTSITLKKISKGFGEIIKIGALATGAVTAVAAAVAGVSVHLASQSGAAQQTALAFGQLDKSLMSAADQSGALKRGLDVIDSAAKDLTKYFNSDEGKKAINDFFQLIVFGAGLAIEKMADLTKAVRHPVDFMEKHLSKWGNFFGMNSKFVEQIKEGDWFDRLVTNARGVGTALKESVLAGKSIVPPTFDDPKLRAEREAAAIAMAERKAARFIELATLAHDKETALSMLSFAVFKLHEEQKMTITGETRSAYIARQAAIEDKLRALDQLEQQIHAKELGRTAALAAVQKDAEDKRIELLQSNADRREEIARTEFERQKLYSERALADAAAKIGMMESGFGKAQALVTQWQRVEGEKRKALAAKETAYALALDQESKEARVSALQEYKSAAEGVLSTVVGAFKDLFRAGLEGSKDMGQVALGILGSIGESILDKLLGMFVSFLATKVAETLVNAAIATTTGIAAAAAQIPAEAALAGAAAVASTAAIPIFGPALAPEAGAAAYAAALAYLPLAALATGGLVLGGSPNFDSVPALLQRGEYVVPAAQVRQNVAAGRAPDDSGSSRGGGAGAGVTISVTQQSFVPGTKADFNRQVRDAVLPSIRQLARQGLLVLK